jgi:hypothetical protein
MDSFPPLILALSSRAGSDSDHGLPHRQPLTDLVERGGQILKPATLPTKGVMRSRKHGARNVVDSHSQVAGAANGSKNRARRRVTKGADPVAGERIESTFAPRGGQELVRRQPSDKMSFHPRQLVGWPHTRTAPKAWPEVR